MSLTSRQIEEIDEINLNRYEIKALTEIHRSLISRISNKKTGEKEVKSTFKSLIHADTAICKELKRRGKPCKSKAKLAAIGIDTINKIKSIDTDAWSVSELRSARETISNLYVQKREGKNIGCSFRSLRTAAVQICSSLSKKGEPCSTDVLAEDSSAVQRAWKNFEAKKVSDLSKASIQQLTEYLDAVHEVFKLKKMGADLPTSWKDFWQAEKAIRDELRRRGEPKKIYKPIDEETVAGMSNLETLTGLELFLYSDFIAKTKQQKREDPDIVSMSFSDLKLAQEKVAVELTKRRGVLLSTYPKVKDDIEPVKEEKEPDEGQSTPEKVEKEETEENESK